jgi:hypothetical protein
MRLAVRFGLSAQISALSSLQDLLIQRCDGRHLERALNLRSRMNQDRSELKKDAMVDRNCRSSVDILGKSCSRVRRPDRSHSRVNLGSRELTDCAFAIGS